MEIERKYLIDPTKLPFDPKQYPCRHIEQGYLCTEPVVRIRRDNDAYFLTYKSKGLLVREEYNLPLTAESYAHLKEKVDGRLITKNRYVIPLEDCLHIELDFFSDHFAGLVLAEAARRVSVTSSRVSAGCRSTEYRPAYSPIGRWNHRQNSFLSA